MDVLIDNSHSQSPITMVYRKKTYTGLLTNYFSFSPLSYKLVLIRTLVDRTYQINNTWQGFHEDIKKLVLIVRKNIFPSNLIERVINQYITKTREIRLMGDVRSRETNSRETWVLKRHLGDVRSREVVRSKGTRVYRDRCSRDKCIPESSAFKGNARLQGQAFQGDVDSKENAFQKDACSRK